MIAWWWLLAPSNVSAQRPGSNEESRVSGSGPIEPSALTPFGIGRAVPTTSPLGSVNQNETASPGVKPVPLNTMVVPGPPEFGVADPLTVPEVSHVPPPPGGGGGGAFALTTLK